MEWATIVPGADPYQEDVLGGLRLTVDGLAKRDHYILHEAVSRQIPVVTVTAGGYARVVTDTVKIHAQTCTIAKQLFKEFAM